MTVPHVHPGGPTEDALFEWLGGRLHPEAAQWIGAHVTGCRRCTERVRRIEAVREALEPPAIPPFQLQRDVTAVRRRLAAPRRRPPLLWASAGLTLAVACAGVLMFLGRGPAPRPVAQPVPLQVHARSGAAGLEVGDEHQVLEANVQVPSGGRVRVEAGSRVAARWGSARLVAQGGRRGADLRLEASEAATRRLRLERGRVVLDVDPLVAGQRLEVLTSDATVSVRGTVFFVEKTDEGTTVAVSRGRVRVASRGRAVDVQAGFRLGPAAVEPVPMSDEDHAAFEEATAWRGTAAGEPLDVLADVAGAEVWVDGVPQGRTPLSMTVPPGVHTVRVAARGRLPLEQRVGVQAGAPTLFHAELERVVEAPEEPAPAKPEGPRPAPAGDALKQARAEVLAGAYGRALKRLQALKQQPLSAMQAARVALLEAQAHRLDGKPERAVPILERTSRGVGPEAEQAMLLLGQTLQRDLLDPRRAAAVWADGLRRFPQGIFREEVAFRLGESLLQAGETRAGVAALERYLEKSPKAPHADEAHLQIAAARRDRLGDCAGAVPHLRVVAAGTGPRAELALVGEARCLSQLGREAEARAAWSRYLEAAPRARFADEARAWLTGHARKQ